MGRDRIAGLSSTSWVEAIQNDGELWEHLDAGNWRAAGTWLVERHTHAVVSVCRAMVRDATTAEDLAQEVFSRAFASLQGYRGEASSRSWLLTIARNRCIDYLRARQREGGYAIREDASEPDMFADQKALPPELLSLRDEVQRALASLGENERALIVLRFRHGLDYRELAAVFGQREGTLRMRLSRTLERMRGLLEVVEAPPAAPAPQGVGYSAERRAERQEPPMGAARRQPAAQPPHPRSPARRPPVPGAPAPARSAPGPDAPRSRPVLSQRRSRSAPQQPAVPTHPMLQVLEAIDAGVSQELLQRLYRAAAKL